MKVGDYIRTDSGIHQITKYKYEPEYENCHVVWFDNNDYGIRYTNNEIKPSPDVTDLIEVGDVITTNNLCGEITKIDGDKIYTTCYDGEYCSVEDIKSIVTKEQFKSMEYRIK